MVRKITLFEFHMDGSQFGPATIQTATESKGVESEADESEANESEADESAADAESKSAMVTFLQGVLVFFVLFFLLWVLFSRLSSGDEE